jgi:signal transduction histidine kinase
MLKSFVLGLAVLFVVHSWTRASGLDGGRSISQYVHTMWGTKEGFTGGAVYTIAQSSDGYLWLGTERGLVRFDGSQFTLVRTPLTGQRPLGAVRGLVDDAYGNLWIRLDGPRLVKYREGVFEDAVAGYQLFDTVFTAMSRDNAGGLLLWGYQERLLRFRGHEDGLTETEGARRYRSLVSDSSGRIWISLLHSLAVADANAAEAYRKPVEVRIESIATDGLISRPDKKISLPSDTRSITFQYAGTSLVMPGATRFRYRLDGLDQTWSAGAASRQVAYTHLSPASYTFRIMAANASGVWNGPEADIAFTVKPAFWQTWYFRVLGLLMIAVFASALYRLRLMQVTGRLNRRFQDRLAERTRIAQDLHDTLLQGVISASMQLEVAQDYLPADSLAKPMLARVLELMQQVTGEGREALRGLRTPPHSLSLEMMFRGMVSEVSTSSTSPNLVHVQGRPRLLRIAVMDEVYRIGREAYINAVAHAGAKRIEVTLLYESRAFRLVVSDDGCGISAGMAAPGPEGPRGLAEMREGAAAIGSELTIHTRTPGGTDVRLRVPAAIAYADASARRITRPWRLRKG